MPSGLLSHQTHSENGTNSTARHSAFPGLTPRQRLGHYREFKLQHVLLFTLTCTLAAQPDETRRRIAATLFVPDSAPALAPVSYGSFEPTPGVVAERISYGTEFGMRIPAILYRPSKPAERKAPAL